MHAISKKGLISAAGYFDDVEKSYDRQPMEKCRRVKRPQFTSKNWIYSGQ